VHPVTRYHLVRHLLAAAQQDPELRRSLPMGVDLADPDVLGPHLGTTVAALVARLAQADVAAAADSLGDTLRRQTRPEPLSPLAQLDAAAALTADTALRLRVGLRVGLSDDADGDHIRMRLIDRAVLLPRETADALKAVLTGEVFTPSGLPGLADGDQLIVARRLLREGVVVPAGAPA
jgi:hypothetical protein